MFYTYVDNKQILIYLLFYYKNKINMNFGARRAVDDSETYKRVSRLAPPPANMYPTTSMSARGQRRVEEWNKLKNSECIHFFFISPIF